MRGGASGHGVPCITAREEVKGKPSQGKVKFGPYLGNSGHDGRGSSVVGFRALLRARQA